MQIDVDQNVFERFNYLTAYSSSKVHVHTSCQFLDYVTDCEMVHVKKTEKQFHIHYLSLGR